MTQLHGVLREGEGTGQLRFGMHKPLFRIGDRSNETGPEPWKDIWMDGFFAKGRIKFHRVCWDALHAADRLEQTTQTAGEVLLDPTRGSFAEMNAIAAAP